MSNKYDELIAKIEEIKKIYPKKKDVLFLQTGPSLNDLEDKYSKLPQSFYDTHWIIALKIV